MTETNIPTEFTRTTCACAECVECCKQQPGPLAPKDLGRIAKFLDKRPRDILWMFWASPGALVANTFTGERRMIGTITPRMRDGRCVFLTADDKCSIHEVAPFGCSYADTHMPEETWGPRASWLYSTIEQDADYQSLRRMLIGATSWRPRTGRSV